MARREADAPERLNLNALRTAVYEAGASWHAEDTGLAALPPQEQAARLGLRVEPAELESSRALIAAANRSDPFLFGGVAAPPAVDWRSNGGNFITPIRDQQSCGSCVSFGTLATIEARVNIACRTPGTARDYSEAYLFYCGCGNCCGTGWNFAPALDFCKNRGVAAEASFPYTPGDKPCPSGITPLFNITGYTTALSTADRKNTIARGPVVAGLAIYQDFYAYRSGVYRHVQGPLMGYHAVSVVGYDDAQQCWIAKNSWGPAWGEAGFFRIGYGQVEIDTTFPFFEPVVTCPQPVPPSDPCQQYLPYLQRVINAARSNSLLRRCLLYYICGRGIRPRCPAQHLTVVGAVRTMLTQCPQYRDPFCRALS
jgi:C1A family cysteine protease